MGYFNNFSPVQHLRRATIKNGGLCYVLFARWQDVLQWPSIDPATGICNTAIKLIPTATFFELQIPDNERLITETEQKGNGGPFVDIQVSGYVGGNNTKHTLGSQAMQYNQFVLLVKDRDGLLKLVGDEDSGAEFTYTYTSGDISNSRKRPVVFKWQSANGVVIYNSPDSSQDTDIIVPPFARLGDFSDDFNNDFNN